MMMVRNVVAVMSCALALGGCGGGSATAAPSAAIPAPGAVGHATSGTISWSKSKVHLQYPAHGRKSVVLNFWGPDGYFTEPMYCAQNSRIAVSHDKVRGNPSGDEYVTYTFRAKSPGPDSCTFDAVLGTTGSPPIAVLKLAVGK